MWKWTDSSQQLGVLQHRKKFKYTRKVGNRYYYDDRNATISISKEVPDLVRTYMEQRASKIWDEVGIPRSKQHRSVTKNKDGGYDLVVTDKTNGKTVYKKTVKEEDIKTLNSSLSSVDRNMKTNTRDEASAHVGYINRLTDMSDHKISNLMRNKSLAKKKKVSTYDQQ